jgi:hypothetical protein
LGVPFRVVETKETLFYKLQTIFWSGAKETQKEPPFLMEIKTAKETVLVVFQ